MKIVAITPFTGSEKLVAMTESCIEELRACALPPGVEMRIVAVNNAASRGLSKDVLQNVDELTDVKNYGFGVGVNRGIDYALIGERWHVDHFLIFNNDLRFPDKNWLVELLKEVETPYVLSPRTDITATKEACHPGPADLIPTRSPLVSAFCWLVPHRIVQMMDMRWKYPLFCPQFSNYGSDDATAAILRFTYGGTPFKIVHRSFVQHLKAQTANELGEKAGTKQLLTDLKQWMRANKLK
jgi:hypothetical protein